MREKNVAQESKIVPAIDIEYLCDFFFFLRVKISLSLPQLLSLHQVSQWKENSQKKLTNFFILFYLYEYEFLYKSSNETRSNFWTVPEIILNRDAYDL